MLDAYIIDSIRRDERRRSDAGRARLELPVPSEDLRRRPREEVPDEDADRGVVIIPLVPEASLSGFSGSARVV